MARRNTRKNLQKAYESALRRLSRFGKKEDIRGIDIGTKYTNDIPQGHLALRIHVKKILSTRQLENRKIEPFDKFYCRKYDVYTDVLMTKAIASDHNDILQGGDSVGRRSEAGNGTIGLIVKDNSTKNPAILSNWHVLGGKQGRGKKGDEVTQPGNTNNVVATLEKWLKNEHGDAAIALLRNTPKPDPLPKLEIRLIGIAKKEKYPEFGQKVIKSGNKNKTKLSKGKVDGKGRYFFKPDDLGFPNSQGMVGIDGFIIVPRDNKSTRLSDQGDSGSVWLCDEKKSVVGLHIAGEVRGEPEFAIACYAKRVFEKLGISLYDKEEFDNLMENFFISE